MAEAVRRPMGFGAPLVGEVLERVDDKWTRVVVGEMRDGYVVKDRRRVKDEVRR